MNRVKYKFLLEEGGLVNLCYLNNKLLSCSNNVWMVCSDYMYISPCFHLLHFFLVDFFSFRYLLWWYIMYILHWIFLTINQASKGWCCLCWRCWLGETSWSQVLLIADFASTVCWYYLVVFINGPYLLKQLVFVHFSYNNGLFHLLRSGELCRQRWNQMVRMIGGHREKPFIEQVEVLARRYCPEMLDYSKAESSDTFTGGTD